MAVLLSHSAHGLVWWGVSALPEEHQLLFPRCEKASMAVPEHSEAAHLPLPPHQDDRTCKVIGERFVFITRTSLTVIPPRCVMNQPRAFYRRITVSQWQHMALAQPQNLLCPVLSLRGWKGGCCLPYQSRVFQGQVWKAVCSWKEMRSVKSMCASCHSVFVIMLFQSSQCAGTCLLIGVSAWQSNGFDCRAKSAEYSKNAWIPCRLLLWYTWPWNHMVSASLLFFRIWKRFD